LLTGLVIGTPGFMAAMRRAGMLSPTGACRALGAEADGFVCGEGAGGVVPKPLDRAHADGDTVPGVILGNGIDQDGRRAG
jgi:polyketide synthase PksM/polyketide synthase PksN